MRRYLLSLFIVIIMALSFVMPSVVVGGVANADSSKACADNYLGITTWYRGLTTGSDSSCQIQQVGKGGIPVGTFITKVVLNVIQAGLAVAAYVTIFFLIKGGFSYMTSAGSPDGMSGAKKTITQAIIGLVICLLSAIIVNTIAGVL